jgi:hypothetical protein
MKIKFIAAYRDDPDSAGWEEDHLHDGDGDAEEIIRRLMDNFNATLRPGERARRLVKILSFSFVPQAPKPTPHIWDKASLVTERGGYDRMRCKACGATGKRYGLGQHGVTLDKRQPESCPGYDL